MQTLEPWSLIPPPCFYLELWCLVIYSLEQIIQGFTLLGKSFGDLLLWPFTTFPLAIYFRVQRYFLMQVQVAGTHPPAAAGRAGEG